ncbi:unnamed protein product [Acanthoscelides obtectus]|uniref:BTB domain-containing protein n=1 Tax=Acanthoscelides obtectus TaxID=200917 RepID=A0A9P0QBJ8_ACAOB|nr:unnamed protein product [Acanthoscelides obtectus]CAK1684119.1 Protein abrupt [Acanthoscelides obtectus]
MDKAGNRKTKHCVQSEQHPQQTTLTLCSFMENRNFVDVAIRCGDYVLYAHKVVLAANSAFFKEELWKDSSVQQVVITGCDASVVRSLLEFIYCGKTILSYEHLRYLVAAARTLQIKPLDSMTFDFPLHDDMIVIPKPQFLSKKLKFCGYPSKRASAINSFSDLYKLHKGKKRSRIGAEGQVCVEKTEDSRLATAKKEIASASQANTSIMEKACTESSVKKFPHPTAGFGAGQAFLPTDPIGSNNVIDLTMPSSSEERTPYLFGNEANSIVEIMFKTSDGSLVPVTDELLQNLQKDGLQLYVLRHWQNGFRPSPAGARHHPARSLPLPTGRPLNFERSNGMPSSRSDQERGRKKLPF